MEEKIQPHSWSELQEWVWAQSNDWDTGKLVSGSHLGLGCEARFEASQLKELVNIKKIQGDVQRWWVAGRGSLPWAAWRWAHGGCLSCRVWQVEGEALAWVTSSHSSHPNPSSPTLPHQIQQHLPPSGNSFNQAWEEFSTAQLLVPPVYSVFLLLHYSRTPHARCPRAWWKRWPLSCIFVPQ